jgi:molecular chaperone GrpE
VAAAEAQTIVEGLRLVRSQLEGVLRGYGVERLDALDRDFDPTIHDAIATRCVPSIAMHDTVVDQIAPGYRLNGRLLRPAKVVVGRC